MSLVAGTRLGAYEITGVVGAGGMGEVYAATDTVLERAVAIKVLPEALAFDAQLIARFEQEAKTLAALNHPNVAQIYGLERGGSATAIVMELVAGPTLADRIAIAPIPEAEAIDIAMQIAAALEAAHSHRIVHRDLKPANVKLRPDGTVKVLDFGIAKALETRAGPGASALTTPALTEFGVVLGTAAYMSPEKARGKAVDQRTDIWAFGCVLYEMLTGRAAFGGEDVTTTLARVLERDTSLGSLPATTSPAVRQAIALCLEKDPRKRIADIRDVRLALEGAFSPPSDSQRKVGVAAGTSRFGLATAFMAGAALSAVTVLFLTTTEPPSPRIVPFTVDMPARESLGLDANSQSLAITPDGGSIAFSTSAAANEYQWYLRSIDSLDSRPLPGARLAFETPFFSADGRWIGFDDGAGRMARLSVLGGTPIPIAELPARLRGASWGENGEILYGTDDSGLWRVAVEGGMPEQLTAPEAGIAHRWPQWLPGGRAALFTVSDAQADQIALLDVESRAVRMLVPDGMTPTYVDTGHVVYGVADGSLRAVGFDLAHLTVEGEPVPLLQGVAMIPGSRGAHYALAADGTLVFGKGSGRALSNFAPYRPAWLAESGDFDYLGLEACACVSPSIAPDGTSVALITSPSVSDPLEAIGIWSFEQRTLTPLTFDFSRKSHPVWSPDSSRIAYNDSMQGIVVRRADGAGPVQVLISDVTAEPGSWATDDTLIFAHRGSGGSDVSAVALTPGSNPVGLLTDAFEEFSPVLSPDGRWLAYASGETNRTEIFVRPYPDIDAGKWQVSRTGGTNPQWSPDGSKLFFLSRQPGRVELVVTEIDAEASFAAAPPSVVADITPSSQAGFGFDYAVDPSSGRFLVGVPERDTSSASGDDTPSLIVIQNFLETLKRAAATN
jgi:serine/threonine-protein kinase